MLLTKPKDIDYEIFIFNKYLGLMTHVLAKKEKRSGTTVEVDLLALREDGKGDLHLGYMRRMAIVYRAEKKKILRSNIDLCQHVLHVLNAIRDAKELGKGPLTLTQFHCVCMEKTPAEKDNLLKDWIINSDATFNAEDQYIKRRL